MAAESDPLEVLAQRASAEALARGLGIFPGGISLGATDALWPEEQGIGPFLDLAKTLGKQMIYLATDRLTVESVLDSLALSLDDGEEILDEASPEDFFRRIGLSDKRDVREFLKAASEYYGRLRRVSVEWVHEGIVHRYLVHASWYTPFLDSVADVAELADSVHDEL
jgi:hypothetical protein